MRKILSKGLANNMSCQLSRRINSRNDDLTVSATPLYNTFIIRLFYSDVKVNHRDQIIKDFSKFKLKPFPQSFMLLHRWLVLNVDEQFDLAFQSSRLIVLLIDPLLYSLHLVMLVVERLLGSSPLINEQYPLKSPLSVSVNSSLT